MIEQLTGIIAHKEENHVVLDVGGVGYGLDVSSRTAQSLGEIGTEARLWVVTYVREDALDLYGFQTRGEREVFEIFLGISGVGPKLSLAILSHFSIEQLVQIILKNDAQTLKAVPGIGMKTAEKLLVELKGRVKRLSAGIEPSRLADLTAASPAAGEFEPKSDRARDAVSALEALDLQPLAARRAVAKALSVLGPDADAESLVREGLRHRHG